MSAERREGVVQLSPDVSWVHESFEEPSGLHVHVSVFLIASDEGPILMDSGSFHHRESLASRIEAATGGAGIATLILSHSDYPHSGNIPAFRSDWGDFEIVASCGDADIQGLPYARRVKIGETAQIRGRDFTFLDPPLADRSHTTWVYDHDSRTLFVADGFGMLHEPDMGEAHWGEFDVDARREGVHAFHEQTLPWLEFAEPELVMGAIRGMLDEHPPAWIAPIHGPPIAEADIPAYLSDLERGLERIAGTST